MIDQRTELRMVLIFLCGNLKSLLPNVTDETERLAALTAERLASIIRSTANIEVSSAKGVLTFGEGTNTCQITMEEIYINPPKLGDYTDEEAAYMQTLIHIAEVTHMLRNWFPKLQNYLAVGMGGEVRQLIDTGIRNTAMGYKVEVPMNLRHIDRWDEVMDHIEYIKRPASGGRVTIKLKPFTEVTFHKETLDILDFRV